VRDNQEPTSGTRPSSDGSDERIDLEAALAEIEDLLAGLAPEMVPERIAPQALRGVIGRLTAIERRVRGAKLVLRKAAADAGGWKASGARSAADDIATQEGISPAQARAEIEASKKLADLPAARDAVGQGEMSLEKARAVAEGGAADPGSEQRLVDTARTGDLRSTQDAARQAVIRADERSGGGRAAGVRRRRSLKTWLTLDGEGHGHWVVPPDMHHRFLAALEPYIRQARRDARAAGSNLTPEAINADAMDLLARDVLLDRDDPRTAPDERGQTPPVTPDEAPPSDDRGTGPDTRGQTPSVAPDDGRGQTPTVAPDEAPPGDRPDHEAPPSDDRGTGRDTRGRTPTVGPDHASGATARDGAPDDGMGRTRPVAPDPAGTRAPAGMARPRRRAPMQGIVLVDLDALRRGYAVDGETCEVQGLGPVPVEMARDMLRDAVLRLVFTGTDVTVVSTVTRHVPEAVRVALLARDKGRCVVPGCGATRGLQIDHAFVDYARGGPTRLSNTDLICTTHHLHKTHHGWTLTHDARTGWSFTPPDRPPEQDEPP
jgi:hypothetical protein